MPSFHGSRAALLRAGVVSALSIALPNVGLTTLYSAVRLAGYNGPFGTIMRAADRATMEVPFLGGIPDITSVATVAFCGSDTIRWTKVCDQSGNGNHLTAPSFAVAPDYNLLTDFGGIRPISFPNIVNLPTTRYMRANNVAVSTSACALYMLANPHTDNDNAMFCELTSDKTFSSGTQKFQAYTLAGQSFGINDTTVSFYTKAIPRLGPQLMTFLLRGNSSAIRFDGNAYTGAMASAANPCVGLQFGQASNSNGFGSNFDLFFFAAYSTSHSDAQAAVIEAAITAAFGQETAAANGWSKKVVYSGSSLITSYYSTLSRNTPRLVGFGRGAAGGMAEWEAMHVAIGGRTLATEYAAFGMAPSANGQAIKNLYNAARTKNVLVIDAPSNDIANTTFSSASDAQAWATDFVGTTTGARSTATSPVLKNYVQAALATGFRVVAPTVISRLDFNTTSNWLETARLAYNSTLASVASSHGFTVSDRAAVPQLSDCTNTSFFYTDEVHLNDKGYAYLAACDKAAILAA